MATSDVEMHLDEGRDAAHGDDGVGHHSPITVDSPSPPPPTTSTHHGSHSPSSRTHPSSLSPSNEPASPSSAHPASAGAKPSLPPTSTKPRSSTSGHKPRSPSPSPPPPPVKPPAQTIRLDIQLGGPEDYEVDINRLSKETGQRPPTPPIIITGVGGDESDESEPEEQQDDMKPKKRRKRKNAAQEYYDTSDPFIDDSELAVDERTFFAQTKQQGFYVSSGQVALLTDKAPAKKPKSRASKKFILPPSVSISAALSNATLPPALSAPLSTSSSKLNSGNKMLISKVMNETNSSSAPPGPSKMAKSESSDGFGTKDSPIPLDDEAPTYITTSPTSGMKRKVSGDESFLASGSVASVDGENKKRKKIVQIKAFPPELEALIGELKDAIGKESWTVKGKFPQTLKPLLSRVALKAIVLNEYNDNFFNLMPKIFPYNRFTMTKLIKRTVWRDHTNILVERQNVLLGELKKLADEGFAKAQDEWERSVGMWERRQTVRTDGQDGLAPPTGGQAASAEGTPVPSSAQPTPLLTSTALPPTKSLDDGADMDVDDALHPNGKQPSAKDAHPPAKRYRLTDQMKGIIWALVCLSNECCRIENEKNELENNHQIVSDQGVRKTLYQKIVACYPEGWLSSGQISREVSVMKKKYERDVMENAEGEP